MEVCKCVFRDSSESSEDEDARTRRYLKAELRRLKREKKERSKEEAQDGTTGILKERVKFFSEHTTMHGLDQMYGSGSMFGKWFWAIVLSTVLGIVMWQLWKIVAFFLENHTLTSISVVYPQEGLEFPSFTICTLMKLNQTAIDKKKDYNHVDDEKEKKILGEFSTMSFLSAYSTALMDVNYFNPKDVDPADTEIVINDLQKRLDFLLRKKTLLEFVEDVTFDCEKMFLACWFENGNLFPCCEQDTSKTGVKMKVKRYLLHSGACYEFESLGMKQRLPGPVGGFGFVFWYPNQDVQETVFNSYDEHAIHLYTSPSEAMLEKAPVALQATKMTRQLEDQLGRTMCTPQTLKYFSEYTYPSCQAECMIDGMLDKCKCTGVSTYANIPANERICTPKEAFDCYEIMAQNFTSMLIKCRKEKCQEACTYWKYKPTLNVGRVFPPHIEKEMIKYWRLPGNNDPAQSLVIADIYFSDIEYTDIQQMPAVTIESFISNIGGAMGLWTGASIITWIHLVFFCCSSWCIHREGERKQSVLEEKKRKRSRRRVSNGVNAFENLPLDPSSRLRNSKIILAPPTTDQTTAIAV